MMGGGRQSRTHQWSATLSVWEINRHEARRELQEGLHHGMLVEESGDAKRADRLDPADGCAGRIEGEERDVSVGDDSIEDV